MENNLGFAVTFQLHPRYYFNFRIAHINGSPHHLPLARSHGSLARWTSSFLFWEKGVVFHLSDRPSLLHTHFCLRGCRLIWRLYMLPRPQSVHSFDSTVRRRCPDPSDSYQRLPNGSLSMSFLNNSPTIWYKNNGQARLPARPLLGDQFCGHCGNP